MKKYYIQLLEKTKAPTDKTLRGGVLKVRHEKTIEANNFSYAQNQALEFYGTDGRGTVKSPNHHSFKIRVKEIS